MDGSPSSLRAVFVLTVMMILSLLFSVGGSEGQTTSITSSGLSTTIQHTPGSSTTNIRGGTLSTGNSNLFHSFGEFSIASNETALFQNLNGAGEAPLVSAPGSVSNIIGRVTGANLSNIYGTVNTQRGFPSATLFLINPQGIMVGPSARFNVGGSIHLSTADYLGLGSGNDRFYADLGKTSQLTSAEVTAFGFLGEHPVAPITVEAEDMLGITHAKVVSMIGGSIEIRNGTISPFEGQLNIVSVASAGEVTFNGAVRPAQLNADSFARLGGISMQNAKLDVSGSRGAGSNAAGTVLIKGGQLVLDHSSIQADTQGSVDAASPAIDIKVSGDVDLTNNSLIKTNSSGSGAGSNVSISSSRLSLSNSVVSVTNSSSLGRTETGEILFGDSSIGNIGSINIAVARLDLNPGSTIESFSFAPGSLGRGDIFIKAGSVNMAGGKISSGGIRPDGSGLTTDPGNVFIRSSHIELTNNSSVTTDTSPGSGGKAGSISLITGTLKMDPGTSIAASSNGTGEAGNISITATDHVTLSGPGATVATDTSSAGAAGSITINANQLTMTNGSKISSSSTSTGPWDDTSPPAGSAGQIVIRGQNGDGSSAQSITLDNSRISTTISGGTLTAPRANIDLSAQTIRLANGAHITADTSGDASAGDITLHAVNVATSNGAKISSSSTSTGTSAGPAGGIVIEGPGESFAESVSVDNGSLSIILRGGDSEPIREHGHISLLARSISLENGAHIEADTSGGASAGAILFQGNGRFAVSKGVRITSTSTGTGHAGDILVGSGDVVIENSTLSTSATQASAGSIRVVAPNMVGLTNAQLTSTAESGKGGTIAIQSGDIAINNGSLVSTSTTGPNDAGNILLTSGSNVSLANSTVSTSATQASGGNITLTAPNIVRLVGANLTSSVGGPPGSNGGNITIDKAHPQFVIMQGNSQILAKANAGQGGAITIIGGVVLQEPGSLLDATAGPAGISGSINIQAPFQQLSGAIAPLPQAFAVASSLYGQRCATQKGGQFSSFVQGARDGVPPQPGDLIPSPLMMEPDDASSGMVLQSAPSLAAIRLGLPEFEQTSRRSLTIFAGCRS